jgi:hypothetical protein
MIGLVLNLSWGPVAIKALASEQQIAAIPYNPWSDIAASQANAFDCLGWENHSFRDDMWVAIDEEILAPDPDYDMAGLRGLSDHFDFTVTKMNWQSGDWASYSLGARVLADLQATNSTASFVQGFINSDVKFAGLTVSFDDPLGELPRQHHLFIMDGERTPLEIKYRCDKDPDGYDDCVDEAGDDLGTCKTVADNDFSTCCYRDGATGAGVGGFLGCVIGKLKTGGAAGAAGVKVILVLCGLGALVGAAVAIFGCYLDFKNDIANCYVFFQNDLDDCRREHCLSEHLEAEPLP